MTELQARTSTRAEQRRLKKRREQQARAEAAAEWERLHKARVQAAVKREQRMTPARLASLSKVAGSKAATATDTPTRAGVLRQRAPAALLVSGSTAELQARAEARAEQRRQRKAAGRSVS